MVWEWGQGGKFAVCSFTVAFCNSVGKLTQNVSLLYPMNMMKMNWDYSFVWVRFNINSGNNWNVRGKQFMKTVNLPERATVHDFWGFRKFSLCNGGHGEEKGRGPDVKLTQIKINDNRNLKTVKNWWSRKVQKYMQGKTINCT